MPLTLFSQRPPPPPTSHHQRLLCAWQTKRIGETVGMRGKKGKTISTRRLRAERANRAERKETPPWTESKCLLHACLKRQCIIYWERLNTKMRTCRPGNSPQTGHSRYCSQKCSKKDLSQCNTPDSTRSESQTLPMVDC